MKIAIIGTGVSGLVTAWLLRQNHDLHVFDSADYIGGHTSTISVNDPGAARVDTGFIVYNQQNYPHLCRLFDLLGVEGRDSDMSFSVHCEKTGLEYNGTGFNGLFVQRANLVNPSFWFMLRDILRFHRQAPAELQAGLDDTLTVDQFVQQHGYGRAFVDHYLIPLGASLWSAPARRFRDFPMRFVLEFLDNHCMLQVKDRPVWRTVQGGSQTYVTPLVRDFRDRIRLQTPVKSVQRSNSGVRLTLHDGHTEDFDEVIIAAHADQALAMLVDPDPDEREILSGFPYQANDTVLHTDTRVLPDRRAAWASWNYRIPATERGHVSVSYNMNRLQGLTSDTTYCVSLNQSSAIDPAKVIARFNYHHPVFQPGRQALQARHPEMIRRRGISWCGAYWGYGFHEDGVNSALRVAEAYDRGLP